MEHTRTHMHAKRQSYMYGKYLEWHNNCILVTVAPCVANMENLLLWPFDSEHN